MEIDLYEKAKELRNNYRACLKLADETDSKKEDRYLRSEARALLEELVKICPHQDVVILHSHYQPYSWDEDPTPEHRKCLCCCKTEEKYSKSGEKFEILKDEGVQWRFESKHPDQIVNPLKYLLTECQEVAATGYKPLIGYR